MPEAEGVLVRPASPASARSRPGPTWPRSIAEAVAPARPGGPELRGGDVVVVTQKIVSKAEGKLVAVDHADPDGQAGAGGRGSRCASCAAAATS